MNRPRNKRARASTRKKLRVPYTTKPKKKYPFPVPIPPCSVVAVKGVAGSPWATELGRVFRIGYYGRTDGQDCIWLVDEEGNYSQTLDHDYLHKFFEIRSISKERSLYGRGRPKFGLIRARKRVSESGKNLEG